MGVRPPSGNIVEPGEWPHGWQYHANQAHLHSHSGHGSSFALSGTPTNPEFEVEPHHCKRGQMRDLDSLGRHRAACPRSGRLHQSFGTRKVTCQDLPGGGSHCTMQCQAEGHGHRSVCTGREGNRSSRIGTPTAPRSAACSRRHSPVRPDSERRSSPQRCSGGRRSMLKSQS